MDNLIYKICDQREWHTAQAVKRYDGSRDDQRDGFIHFSTVVQLRETAQKHFAGRNDLILLCVRAKALGAALKWEPSRGGDLFPHLYADLPITAVTETWDLLLNSDGTHIFPKDLICLT